MQIWKRWTRATLRNSRIPTAGIPPAAREFGRVKTMEEDINLELNTDAVRERTGVGASLTDTNKINIFTDDFEMKKEERHKAEQDAEVGLRGKVFDYRILYESKDITDRLFLESTGETIAQNEQITKENRTTPSFALITAAVMITVSVSVYCLIRKERKKHDVDNQHKARA